MVQGSLTPDQQITIPIRVSFYFRYGKRLFDLMVGISLLVILVPVYVLVSLLVLFSSRGPIFYSQERLGQLGRPFTFYKFRSMYVNSEPDGPQLSIGEEDPRVTGVGKFLRKTKLDEIPQLWNVLKGNMSLVGPRPERPFYVEKAVALDGDVKALQRIRPGITSIGQIEFGYAHNLNDVVERMRIDLKYRNSISLRTDLSILFRTVLIVLFIAPKPKKSRTYKDSH